MSKDFADAKFERQPGKNELKKQESETRTFEFPSYLSSQSSVYVHVYKGKKCVLLFSRDFSAEIFPPFGLSGKHEF